MINSSKSFNVDTVQHKNGIIDTKPVKVTYINVFCPRCGKFNVRRHRVFKRRFLCEECGYKWKN